MSLKKFLSWSGYIASIAILVVALVGAVACVGYTVGWLTGASMTPVVAVVIPLVFGLLAAIGLGVKLPHPFGSIASIWQAALTAVLVIVFCYVYVYGVTKGSFERSGQYRHMPCLLGEAWDNTDDETLASLYKFRLQSQQANVPPVEFEPIIKNVVKPILQDDQPDKPGRVKKALTTIEAALPARSGE